MRRLSSIAVSGAFLAIVGTANAQGIADTVYDGLKGMIESEVRAECIPGSAIAQRGGTFSLAANGNVIVRMGGFDCDWEFSNNFFCGVRYCTAREYEVIGSDIGLVSEYLE